MGRQRQIDDAFEQAVKQAIAVRQGRAKAGSAEGAFNKYVQLAGISRQVAQRRIDGAIEERFGKSN